MGAGASAGGAGLPSNRRIRDLFMLKLYNSGRDISLLEEVVLKELTKLDQFETGFLGN